MISIYIVLMIGVVPCIIHSHAMYYGRTTYIPYMYTTPTNYVFQTTPVIIGENQKTEQAKSVPEQNQLKIALQQEDQKLERALNTLMSFRYPINYYRRNVETQNPATPTNLGEQQQYVEQSESVPQQYQQPTTLQQNDQELDVDRNGNLKTVIGFHRPISHHYGSVVAAQEPPTSNRGEQQQTEQLTNIPQGLHQHRDVEPTDQDNNGIRDNDSITRPQNQDQIYAKTLKNSTRKRRMKQLLIGEDQQRHLLNTLHEKKLQIKRKPPKKKWDDPIQRSKFIQSIYRDYMINREYAEDDFKKIQEKYGGTKNVEKTSNNA